MLEYQLIAGIIFACLTLYVLLDGYAQGGITGRNRLYVPPKEQPAINTDLHLRLPLCYALTCVCAAGATYEWRWLAIGGLLRLALFDASLNLRKGDKLFALGSSAWSDKLLSRAPWLNPVLRGGALVAAVALLVWP